MPRHSGLTAAVPRSDLPANEQHKRSYKTQHKSQGRQCVNASKCQGNNRTPQGSPSLCVCIADVAGILTQTTSLESIMSTKRVEQLCRQGSGLVGLLVEMQGIHSSQGQPRLPVCMRSQRLKQT